MSSMVVDSTVSKTVNLSDILGFINTVESSTDFTGIPVQVSFLRNFTVEGIEPFFKYHCLASGLNPDIIFGNYDMVRQEILDTTSHIYSTSPDIIVAALFLETYLPDGGRGDWASSEVMNELAGLFLDIAKKTDAVVAVNTFIPPFYSDHGISSSGELPSRDYEILQLNQLVREFVRANSTRFVLVDWERIVRILGEEESIDYRFWYMSKAPFKKNFLNHYAAELVTVARALKGRTKKCLVLDCDNTLWGGIVGEDGAQGINLDRHSYPGIAFYEFQKSVLALQERGVLITLCSKNNEQDVWDVLDSHQHCVLKREHLSAWRINWQDKATNIKALASELNLGLESFVFVDDNPTECGLIRDLLPEVTVFQVPAKLYTYPMLMSRSSLFDTLTLSAEDRQRSRMYQEEVERKNVQATYETLEQYLTSLALSISVHKVNADEAPRVAQLTQKTNQFNLTTRRYSEPQITAFVDDPAKAVISLSVQDKFGDSGLTGVLIAQNDNGYGVIDVLLMSCRVLGRNLEVAFVLKALEIMEREWQIKTWKAEFIPTLKNQQVAEFWSLLGFTKSGHEKEGHSFYELKNSSPRPKAIPYITIEEE